MFPPSPVGYVAGKRHIPTTSTLQCTETEMTYKLDFNVCTEIVLLMSARVLTVHYTCIYTHIYMYIACIMAVRVNISHYVYTRK